MAFRSVGINQPGGTPNLPDTLETLKYSGADFVELLLPELGVILGGTLDRPRLKSVREALLPSGLSYTVHAPLEADLMDLDRQEIQKSILISSVRFAGEIGADIVVFHAGQRVASRDVRYRFKDQLAAERAALRDIGDTAAELGVTVAVENYFPDQAVLRGEAYDYSTWPPDLAEQVAAVDHPAVGICLDVGHAALASGFFGFDFVEACAAAAPLVRHIHLHDNLNTNCASVNPSDYGDPVYGTGDLHLPPGRGSIPLADLLRQVEFPADPRCCLELSPDLFHEAPQALLAARELSQLASRRKLVV
ncbi:MAG: sugar phosphate isomerase/epimerase family protein [Rubrobacteraceae bacterium]